MEKYEVFILSKFGAHRSLIFSANTFDDAEIQAIPHLEKDEIIWKIQRDYTNAS